MAQSEQPAYERAMDRVSSRTQARQQKPEYKDHEHERFAIYSRVAEADGQYGHRSTDD